MINILTYIKKLSIKYINKIKMICYKFTFFIFFTSLLLI